jgi:hypothetical protein
MPDTAPPFHPSYNVDEFCAAESISRSMSSGNRAKVRASIATERGASSPIKRDLIGSASAKPRLRRRSRDEQVARQVQSRVGTK